MTTFFLLFVVLLLLGFDLVDATGCPHCHGNFNSCTWASNNKCPADTVVAANAVVMAAGTGLITLAGIIKPRFLKLFSQVAFDTIIALVHRSEPGTPFQISKTTTATAILTAVSNSLITLDIAVFKLCELIEDESDPSAAAPLIRRLECVKTASEIQAQTIGPGTFTGLMDSGILTFMMAKVSNFVMNKEMQIKLHGSKKPKTASGSSDYWTKDKYKHNGTDLNAKLTRPTSMVECGEMFNLFILYVHALAISNVLVVTDFIEHAFYDTVRRREKSWQFAFELVLVMFRRIEDSGGRLNLGNVYEETYLNTVMDEAQASFLRVSGAVQEIDDSDEDCDHTYTGRQPTTSKHASIALCSSDDEE